MPPGPTSKPASSSTRRPRPSSPAVDAAPPAFCYLACSPRPVAMPLSAASSRVLVSRASALLSSSPMPAQQRPDALVFLMLATRSLHHALVHGPPPAAPAQARRQVAVGPGRRRQPTALCAPLFLRAVAHVERGGQHLVEPGVRARPRSRAGARADPASAPRQPVPRRRGQPVPAQKLRRTAATGSRLMSACLTLPQRSLQRALGLASSSQSSVRRETESSPAGRHHVGRYKPHLALAEPAASGRRRQRVAEPPAISASACSLAQDGPHPSSSRGPNSCTIRSCAWPPSAPRPQPLLDDPPCSRRPLRSMLPSVVRRPCMHFVATIDAREQEGVMRIVRVSVGATGAGSRVWEGGYVLD